MEAGGTLCFQSRLRAALSANEIEVLAERPDEPAFEEVRGHASEFAGEAILDHFADANAYPKVTARSRRMTTDNERLLRLSLPAVLHGSAASGAVESVLRDHRAGLRRLTFRLSPMDLAVVPGDVVRLRDGPDGAFLVTSVTEGEVREVEARSFAGGNESSPEPIPIQTPRNAGGFEAAAFLPEVHFLDLPCFEDMPEGNFARVAAYAKPWRPIFISSSSGTDGYRFRVRLDRPARIGRLTEALQQGPWGSFDNANAIELYMVFGDLASKDANVVLAGENRIAVASSSGAWEIIGFREAEETEPNHWRLTGLLRGLAGSEDAMADGHPSGSVAVILDEAVAPLSITVDEAGRPMNWLAEARGVSDPPVPMTFAGGTRARTPIAPVHLDGVRLEGGDIRLSWIRRARRYADGWDGVDIPLDEPFEKYRVEILSSGFAVRTVQTGEPHFDYPLADEINDFGSGQTQITFRVRQLGFTMPDGIAATKTISL